MNRRRFPYRPRAGLRIVPRLHPLREAAERCAIRTYESRYDAQIAAFPDLMTAVVDEDDAVAAVAGVRHSASGFFSEAYLACSVEQRLAQISGDRVRRESIVEFTTLAAAQVGAGTRLIVGLVESALYWGFEWSFFTATASLRDLLAHHSVPLRVLGVADPARIADAGRWGRYYAADPMVCATWRADLTAIRPPFARPVTPLHAPAAAHA